MPANNRALKVFLCYAHVDAVSVYSLYEDLIREGVDVWLDKAKLVGGDEWENEIRKAVHDSDVVIVCLSRQFNQRGFRQKEVRIALEDAQFLPRGEIFIIPARLEECDVMEDLQKWQWVDIFEKDGKKKLIEGLQKRARQLKKILRSKNKISKFERPPISSEQTIPDNPLLQWLLQHNLVKNPFGNIDIGHFSPYPNNIARPINWESFMDPVSVLANCPTDEDAHALALLARHECLSFDDEQVENVSRMIFPVWIDNQHAKNLQSPIATLAYSESQLWLRILSVHPIVFSQLPLNEQNDLLELLCWSIAVAPNKMLINLFRNGVRKEGAFVNALIRSINDFQPEQLTLRVPKTILWSWLTIKPARLEKTYMILLSNQYTKLSKGWYENFVPLIPKLFREGIVTKVLTSNSVSTPLRLPTIELVWNYDRLYRSLNGLFDAAISPEEKSIGKAIRFHELFGFGAVEEIVTGKLISASRNSLARMLILGNRLLQYHCGKYGASEKYLYPADLETILKTA